jgi:antitoxin CptB
MSLSRLRWRCRRGMRELDTLLTRFLEQCWDDLEASERERFEALLELQDPQLYAWMLGREQPADPAMALLVERILATRAD